MADLSPGGFPKSSAFSLDQFNRFRTTISFPHGSTKVQILAFWFVSKRPVTGEHFMASVPFLRFSVCPRSDQRCLASAHHLLDTPLWVMALHFAEHSFEQVTRLLLGGSGKSFLQIAQTFQFRPAYFGVQSGQNCGIGSSMLLAVYFSPQAGQVTKKSLHFELCLVQPQDLT